MLDDDTFRERAKSSPATAPLRELRHALGKMRLNSLTVGRDRRNRTGLMPFGSKTGRNQPSNSRGVFGASRWLRSLIQPQPGRALAYVDWSSQEIAIAAALSSDEALWEAYTSGDPYIAFAKQAGLVPPDAAKQTHKAERQRAKAIVLGVGYGMSADSMALQAGLPIDEARDLLLRHKLTYRKFWAWAMQKQNAGLLGFNDANHFRLDVAGGRRHTAESAFTIELANASQRCRNAAAGLLRTDRAGQHGLLGQFTTHSW